MVKTTLKGVIQVLGGLGAGMAIMLVLIGWRLSAGPISLAFLTPYVEEALNGRHSELDVHLDDTILTWAGWERTLDIRIRNFRLVDSETGALAAAVPELSLSLSAQALLDGLVAPKSIELFGPRLRLQKHERGIQVAFAGSGEGRPDVAMGLLRELLAPPSKADAMSYLTRVTVIDGDLEIVDATRGLWWQAPNAQVTLERDRKGIQGDLTFDLVSEGAIANVSAVGNYDAASTRFDFGVTFSELTPAIYAKLAPILAQLGIVDIPLRGTVTASILEDGKVESVGFNLTGSEGNLDLPGNFVHPFKVRHAMMRGGYDGDEELLEFSNFRLDLGDEGRVQLAGAHDHVWPVKSIDLKAKVDFGRRVIGLTKFDVDLGGPKAQLYATLTDIPLPGDPLDPDREILIDAEGRLTDVPIDSVEQYWPATWGKSAHVWVSKNLSVGDIADASISIAATARGDDLKIERLGGTMVLSNVSVDYLPPMPKVTGVNGTAKFDQRRFVIYASEGQVENLQVSKGTIFLTGLDEHDQFADIDLTIDGPVRTAMALIEHEPLTFASAVGLAPERTAGEMSTRLKLYFLLAKDLTLDQVQVSAQSLLKNASIEKVFLNRDLTEGDFTLLVDKDGINMDGSAVMSGIPADVSWRRNFADTKEFIERYDISGKVVGVTQLTDLGLDVTPFAQDIVEGSVAARIRYTVQDPINRRIETTVDLTDLVLDIPQIDWRKPKGEAGTAVADVRLKKGIAADIPMFSIRSGDLDIRGSALYGIDGTGLERIVLDRVAYGEKTDVTGSLSASADGGWVAKMSGRSFNLGPLWDAYMNETEDDDEKPVKLEMRLELDRVWLGEARSISEVKARLKSDGEHWVEVGVDGLLAGQSPMRFQIAPDGPGKRKLAVRAADAGEMLRTLDIYENMLGGSLVVDGGFDDAQPSSPLSGVVKVQDYRIINAPVVARVVTLMSLTGIVDVLQGDGLGFSGLEAPFTLDRGVLELRDARASGLSLGGTASGTVNLTADEIHLNGTVVPAYAINSILGYIPVIGDIFTGGEKGGGVFAANYTIRGSVEKPDVSVNALSALAPGFLRKVFGIFDQERSTSELPAGLESKKPVPKAVIEGVPPPEEILSKTPVGTFNPDARENPTQPNAGTGAAPAGGGSVPALP